MRAATFAMAALVLAGCARPKPEPPAPTQATGEVEQQIRVRAGESAAVAHDSLRIRFLRVTADSRCPINARCIRAGSAKIEVELAAPGEASVRAILTTPDEPKGTSYGPFDIEALELQPGREIGAPTPRFEAVLRVQRR